MTSRLSSTSASRSLSGLLEQTPTSPSSKSNILQDSDININNNLNNKNAQSPTSIRKNGNTARLTMQSYFDKENKHYQKTLRRTERNDRDKNDIKPLGNSNHNSLNRRSISTSIKSSSNNSFNNHTNTISKRNSIISLTNNNNNNNNSNNNKNNSENIKKSIISDSSNSSKSRNSIPRLSIDTFNSISSSINNYETSNITNNLEKMNIQSTSNNKSKKSSSLHRSIKSNRLSLSNESTHSSKHSSKQLIYNDNFNNDLIYQSNEHNNNKENKFQNIEDINLKEISKEVSKETKHDKKKSISNSTSFRSLRNSLSMRSITSSLRNDDSNSNSNTNHNNMSSDYLTSKAEKRNSLKTKRKMSLENIRSLLSSRRSSLDIHSEYKNNISLPIMQPETKDKIRNRLRNSNSIMSMSSFVSNNDSKNINEDSKQSNKMKTADLHQLHNSLLLKLCNQSRCVTFVSYLNKFQTLTPRRHLTLLSQTSKNFILTEFSCHDSESEINFEPSGIWKIIPIDNDGTPITQVIQELTLTMLMSNKPGFVGIDSAKVVIGPIPSSLLDLIEVNRFPNNQMFLIMRLEYAGVSLKHFNLESWEEASNIVSQILDTLTSAEQLNYEHRDLNFENILIKRINKKVQDGINPNNFIEKSSFEVSIIDHALARGIVSGQLMYRNLYDADFFKGSGEYRHTIYKLMRRAVNNCKKDVNSEIPTSNSSFSLNTLKTESSYINDSSNATDWSKNYPIFNLLWIHYLLHILLFEKGLKPIKMNPILKKKGWLANGGEMGEENAFYERLMQGYRMVEPAVLFGVKKNKYMREIKDIHEFKNWFQGK